MNLLFFLKKFYLYLPSEWSLTVVRLGFEPILNCTENIVELSYLE